MDKTIQVINGQVTIDGLALEFEKLESKILIEKAFYDFGFKFDYLWNVFVNGLFWIAKMEFQIFSGIYYYATAGNAIFNEMIRNTIDLGSSLFYSMVTNFIPLIAVLIVMYASYLASRYRVSFFKTILSSVVVASFIYGIYMPISGVSGVRMIYDRTDKLVTSIAKEASQGLVNPSGSDSETSTSDEIIRGYFENTLWQGYQTMNADYRVMEWEDPETGIVHKYPGYNITDVELIELLDYVSGEEKIGEDGKKVTEIIGSKEDPLVKNMRGGIGNKFMGAIVAIVETFIIGVLLGIIGLMSLILKLGILLFFFIAPLVLVMSMFPFFNHLLPAFGKTIFTYGLLSQFIHLISVFAMTIDSTVRTAYMGIFGNPLIVFGAKVATYIVLWKTRFWWMSSFKKNGNQRVLNRVKSHSDRLTSQAISWSGEKAHDLGAKANGIRKLQQARIARGVSAIRDNRKLDQYMKQGMSLDNARFQLKRDKEGVILKKAENKARKEARVNKRKNALDDLQRNHDKRSPEDIKSDIARLNHREKRFNQSRYISPKMRQLSKDKFKYKVRKPKLSMVQSEIRGKNQNKVKGGKSSVIQSQKNGANVKRSVSSGYRVKKNEDKKTLNKLVHVRPQKSDGIGKKNTKPLKESKENFRFDFKQYVKRGNSILKKEEVDKSKVNYSQKVKI